MVASEVETDINHSRATKLIKEIISGKYGSFFLTDYIFDETVTITALRAKSLAKAIAVGTKIKEAMEILKVDEIAFDAAWTIFKDQRNTKLSFTDCTILSMMHLHGITNVATFDSDFKKVKLIKVIDN